MRRSLNPFRGLPNAREVWAWGMYDLANQSFTLLVTTVFFGIYFKTIVVGDPARGEALWGRSFAIASLIVVVLSPIAGALADHTAQKKRWLMGLGGACIGLTASLALVGPGDVALAMTLYIAANVCFMLGENFLAAFLPEIATRETMGRISATGWTMGYIGALVCLPMALLIPGVATGREGGFRAVFVFAAVWFLFNALPTSLYLRERGRVAPAASGPLLTAGFRRLAQTTRELRRFSSLATFLAVFVVYSCGVQVIIVFSAVIAKDYLPNQRDLVLFIWALAGVSGVGSFVTAAVQDRVGHRRVISAALLVWLATAVGAAALPGAGAGPPWAFWIVGIGVGLGLGTIGSASRALVGTMTPAHKAAEFFAFWGIAYKVAGAIGPWTFGEVSGSAGRRAALLVVAGFFAVGLIGLWFVDVGRGRRAAEQAEAEAGTGALDARAAAATQRGAPGVGVEAVDRSGL
ncbi:MAG: MFS transporter [Phycisphaerales bacterium]|nr:MFS transporter [Phycisphaerales bacterium]